MFTYRCRYLHISCVRNIYHQKVLIILITVTFDSNYLVSTAVHIVLRIVSYIDWKFTKYVLYCIHHIQFIPKVPGLIKLSAYRWCCVPANDIKNTTTLCFVKRCNFTLLSVVHEMHLVYCSSIPLSCLCLWRLNNERLCQAWENSLWKAAKMLQWKVLSQSTFFE